MSLAQPSVPSPRHILHLLRLHVWLWLIPAVLIAVVVGAYAMVYQAPWEASQALTIRNEASSAEKTPGKFNLPEEMKTIQETILEVAKSRSVLDAALRDVGPSADCKDVAAWPSDSDIADARKTVKFAPPKGAEFGKTEVFYLTVRAETPRTVDCVEQSRLQASAGRVPTPSRRQGQQHDRRVDQDGRSRQERPRHRHEPADNG